MYYRGIRHIRNALIMIITLMSPYLCATSRFLQDVRQPVTGLACYHIHNHPLGPNNKHISIITSTIIHLVLPTQTASHPVIYLVLATHINTVTSTIIHLVLATNTSASSHPQSSTWSYQLKQHHIQLSTWS